MARCTKILCLMCTLLGISVTTQGQRIVHVSPSSASRQMNVSVTIRGEGTTFFQGSSTVTNVWLSKGGSKIESESFMGIDATSLTAGFDIPADAAFGPWDVYVSDLVDGNLPPLTHGFSIYLYPDLNGDGRVDSKDLAFLSMHWVEPAAKEESMMQIPAGDFEMGDHFSEGDADELPVHAVYVDNFYMSRYEITNEEYCSYLNSALSQGMIEIRGGVVYSAPGGTYPYSDIHTTDPYLYRRIDYSDGLFTPVTGDGVGLSDHPVVEVSWFGAAAYCNWRSQEEGYQVCYDPTTWECDFSKMGYRLPTEAEWEYAARGGANDPYHRFPWGNSIEGSKANHFNSDDPFEWEWYPTTPVGYYNSGQIPAGMDMANGYGLYDMIGNVWEWCNDWYGSAYYGTSSHDSPPGPVIGTYRVIRGASWFLVSDFCRVANRGRYGPVGMDYGVGFRVVLEIE